MATRITFTDDVGRITTASNIDGSIRWHMYERPFGTGTSIFVRREVNGTLEAEVRFLAEGEKPDILFDPVTAKWIFHYVLNEKAFRIEIDEPDAPVTQAPQTGTVIDLFRGTEPNQRDPQTTAQNAAQRVKALAPSDADNGPPAPDAVEIAAGLTPGTTLTIRWRAKPSTTLVQNLHVAGFNVYAQLFDSARALVQVNSSLVPFVGFDPVLYELEVPARPGRYFVAQVNYNGPNDQVTLVEGRIRSVPAFILSNGVNLPSIVTSIMDRKIGESREPEDLTFTVVDTAPVNIIRADDFNDHGPGESFAAAETTIVSLEVVQVADFDETFADHGPGEAFTAVVDVNNQGGVIIG